MEIVPIGPGFAAEIRGVTLADVAADDAIYAAVRAAFEEQSVLLFRDQQVDGEGQLAFSRRFGPPETTKVGSLGTGTNFVILTTIGPDGKVVPEDHRYAMRNKANQLWHTDSSFKSVPALTSVLAARTIPASGGETEFASTRLAFERLDPALQKQLENSFAWHSYGHSRGKIAEGLASAEEMATLPPVCWRMVWKNPVNGRKALYIASHTYAVEGMEPKAGEKLIEDLTVAATAPAPPTSTNGAPATSSCGTTAPPCIAAGRGPATSRATWCAPRSRRPPQTASTACARRHDWRPSDGASLKLDVHLVGSIGLDTVDEVFSTVGRLLGPHLRRIPDGEVGGRRQWISWQYPLLLSSPYLNAIRPARSGRPTAFRCSRSPTASRRRK